ncbi:MAG: hypothetical protein HY922_04745 [Elusimicrobia bacterium]|nr:hypothetical protein [Elusimicrobiota bacterium]
MTRRILALLACAAAGCISADAVSKGYDFSRLRRVGVLEFDYGSFNRFGAEDIFIKHLLERGYEVIERSRFEALLQEQRLGASGAVDPETAKSIGRTLGVDALVLGQITAYQPERKSIVTVETRNTYVEPVFKPKQKKLPDGSVVEVQEQVGKNVRHEVSKIPQVFPIDAEVGMVVKLVDVETGEVVWVGSETSQGVNAPLAAESASSYLVKQLSKKWKPKG